MYDPKNSDERERVEKVVYDMVDRALDMEGSCTVIKPHPSHIVREKTDILTG